MNVYCILVVTGNEDSFKKKVQEKIDSGELGFSAQLYVFKKLMRLKHAGKIYEETMFPGYVFIQTDTENKELLGKLKKIEGYLKFLPTLKDIQNLVGNDLYIIEDLMQNGGVQRFLRAKFNKDDKIVINNDFFKNYKGVVKDVNRRNQRTNISIELLNGIRVVNLTYFDVEKEDWTKDEENYLLNNGYKV